MVNSGLKLLLSVALKSVSYDRCCFVLRGNRVVVGLSSETKKRTPPGLFVFVFIFSLLLSVG